MKFEMPVIEVVEFAVEDVITTSASACADEMPTDWD